MINISAQSAWFNIDIEGSNFSVYGFKGYEQLNETYEFEIELVSRSADEDIVKLLGKEALFTVKDHSGLERKIHGQINKARQLHSTNIFTHYQIILVPRFWFLGLNNEHRIFQNKSAPTIIGDILKEQHFLSESYDFQLKETYEERVYCVQYNESDLSFISRLCEEEGIYFYFKHEKEKHILYFSDAHGGDFIETFDSEGLIRFFPGSGQTADDATINNLQLNQEINSDAATYREWNFKKPSLDLEVSDKEASQEKAPTPGGLNLENYKFPHLYNLEKPGENFAEIQLKRQLSFSKFLNGHGNVSRLNPGFAFTLFGHPRKDLNNKWWLTKVEHYGNQPQVLEHVAPDKGFFYQSKFVAIPFETRFIPPIKHPKQRIEGLQSAIVTGPSNEEVYVDKYGRVKVQFHWDREGQFNEKTTCWVRVSDSWAGHNFGFIQPPRIGQEVMVEFMEGNPDRPVITGRVYNTDKMPPWELPSQKRLSGIQSREFKGGQRNQLVFDDTEGEVQTQLSSDHGLSQLNLGYLTRVNHIEGRKDFRGEGFELRTDNWGAIRAAKGLFISTDERNKAEEHHKDMAEFVKNIKMASEQQKKHAELAEIHEAYDFGSDVSPLSKNLDNQCKQIEGTGETHKELQAAQMVFSSPDGIALSTPATSHIHAGEDLALTAERQVSVSSSRNFLVTALKKIALFAYEKGIRIFSAKGKIEIHSQDNELDIIAAQDLKIISANETVHISAPKEIILTAGGSYIKINANGIESGTPGIWNAYASQHNLLGPKSEPPLTVTWNTGEPELTPRVKIYDPLGRLINTDRYAVDESGDIKGDSSEHDLKLFIQSQTEEDKMLEKKGLREILADGLKFKLTKDKAVKDED